jgi:hypothetical protein
MIFDALTAIRDRLKNDAGITAALTDWYPEATPNYFIGAKLKPTAQEFPYIAVAPMLETRERRKDRPRQQKISLMFGVIEHDVTDGVSIGLERVTVLGELIYAALDKQPLCAAPLVEWLSNAQMISDAGVQHPHYEAELIFEVTISP